MIGNGKPPNNFRHNKKIRNYFKTVSINILIYRVSIALDFYQIWGLIALEKVHYLCNIALENCRK